MEYAEVIAGIVALEQRAREITRRARDRQSALEADLAAETAALRAEYLARAKHRIDEVTAEENTLAEQSCAAIDARLAAATAEVEAAFDTHAEAWADALFRRMTGGPA